MEHGSMHVTHMGADSVGPTLSSPACIVLVAVFLL